MSEVVLITGSSGLIGSEAAYFFHDKHFEIVGVDNDMRSVFFGAESSTTWCRDRLIEELNHYKHHNIDIRSEPEMDRVFSEYNSDISLIIHAAAQPSHDWAARDPWADFTINTNGTLLLLEKMRSHCPDATFIFVSTNKVYGDTPNNLPFVEQGTRWELPEGHAFGAGIDETMSIDQCKHSLFGVSKASADLLVQEYGRYFGLKTGCFRGGCLTGPRHSGAQLHGFLSYLLKCAMTETEYTIFGYKGKQVRDNLHNYDALNAFYQFYQDPRVGEVYNLGGGRHSNCSVLEAVAKVEEVSGKRLQTRYADEPRIGDHIWWITDMGKFQSHYPEWSYRYDLDDIFEQSYAEMIARP